MSRVYQLLPNIWVGDYPCTKESVDRLLGLGIGLFVSLTTTDEADHLPDYRVWLSEQRIFHLSRKGFLSEKPFDIFSQELDLLLAMSRIYPLYLHCRWGKDRSGTYAAGLLARLHPNWEMAKVLLVLNEELRVHTAPWVEAPSVKAVELRDFLDRWSMSKERVSS
jgi:hypothetical protein